jgi:hypothetical protein
MNSRYSRISRAPAPVAAPDLVWIHDGVRHRASLWPEVEFAREMAPGEWVAVDPSEAALASAALGVGAARWRRYLEFVPAAVGEYLARFEFSRMAALLVRVRCPRLSDELVETPALVAFLAAHRSLRGGTQPGWTEIEAVFEREGIYGLLQWLGLPASRQTLAILRKISDPDLPRRLLEPLRTALWEPETIWGLSHSPVVSDEQLARACHALAA